MEKHVGIKNKTLFAVGLALVLIGVAVPALLNVCNFGVVRDLRLAYSRGEGVYAITSAMRLYALNVLRALPHYLGAFYIGDSLSLSTRRRMSYILVYSLIVGLAICLVYNLIELFHGIEYDLGVPAVMMILFISIILRIDFSQVSAGKKTIMVTFMLCAVQCLDVMPMLSTRGFGRGEMSESIKNAAFFLGVDHELNFAFLALCLLMMVNVSLYTLLIIDENRIRLARRQREQQETELMEAKLRAMENRSSLELKHLVHDLKTPLTSIQTLVGVVKLGARDGRTAERLGRIEVSVEHMNKLISEFLDASSFSRTTVREIVTDLKAQVSNADYAKMLTTELPEEEIWLEANRVRISRMFVNLLENAYYAMDGRQGRIVLRVAREELAGVPMVRFDLMDNGRGMDDREQHSVFRDGYSTRGSSGLGLSFVKEVVESHHGSISMHSAPGEGTVFSISLPEEVPC